MYLLTLNSEILNRIKIVLLMLIFGLTLGLPAMAQDSWSSPSVTDELPPDYNKLAQRVENVDTAFETDLSSDPGPLKLLVDVTRVVTMRRMTLQPLSTPSPSDWGQSNDGTIDATTIGLMTDEGLLSPSASLTIYLKYKSGNPKDTGKSFTVNGIYFNDQLVDNRSYSLQIGYWKKIVLRDRIPIGSIKFGIWQGDGALPLPGHNSIVVSSNMQSIATPDSTGITTTEAIPVGMLEFGAAAPIVMVHGLNCDAQKWGEAGTYSVDCSSPTLSYFKWSNRPDITGSTGFNFGNYDYRNIMDEFIGNPTAQTNGSCTAPPANEPTGLPDWYRGPWSNQITLGFSGVSGVAYDAQQLDPQLRGILDGFGSKRCHIIAHSKGGLDTRYYLDNEYQQLVKAGYEVLSLYTLATPHRGALIAKILVNSYGAYSNDPDIQNAIDRVGLFKSWGSSVLGPISYLTDKFGTFQWAQGVWDLIPENTLDLVPDSLPPINKFYNVAGDGDIDGDGRILNIEAYGQIANCPGGAGDSNLDGQAQYNVLKNCSDVTMDVEWSSILNRFKIKQITSVRAPNQPNDFLVQSSSALLSTDPANLLPGMSVIKANHGNIKQQVVGQAIIQQIRSDYPVSGYFTAPARYR